MGLGGEEGWYGEIEGLFGRITFVEKCIMSLPLTVGDIVNSPLTLTVVFALKDFRSRVSTSEGNVSMSAKQTNYFLFSHTVTTSVKINDISDSHVDNSQKSLIFVLEPPLIEDLDSKDAVLGHFSKQFVSKAGCVGKEHTNT
jgi:hypothetical protein